ncbi:uncharacterized protein [Palaemon carinicauda]|uniref:uncharacterized protein n=1 Tax=Palaemon carinicauda TaxID=392227 RepID=UPI0035B67EE7
MEKEAVLMRKEENISQDISRLNKISKRQVEFEKELSGYEKLLMEKERQMSCQLQDNGNILKEAEKCLLELTNELAIKQELLSKAKKDVLASKFNDMQSLTEERENISYEREKEFENHFSMARQRLKVTEALLEEQWKNLESEKSHLVSREHQMKEYWDGKMAELGARENALLIHNSRKISSPQQQKNFLSSQQQKNFLSSQQQKKFLSPQLQKNFLSSQQQKNFLSSQQQKNFQSPQQQKNFLSPKQQKNFLSSQKYNIKKHGKGFKLEKKIEN